MSHRAFMTLPIVSGLAVALASSVAPSAQEPSVLLELSRRPTSTVPNWTRSGRTGLTSR